MLFLTVRCRLDSLMHKCTRLYNASHIFPTPAVSFTIHVNCPRFLNITASRSFFETASVLTEVIAQSDPETFRAIIFDRDSRYIKNFWDAEDREGSGYLSRDEVLSVMHAVTDMHWKDEMAGLTPAEKAHFIDTFVDLAEREEDGMISLQSILSSFKAYTARCYFSGSKEILLHNYIGRTLKASTKDSLESNLTHHSIMSEADYQRVLGTFLSVEDDSSCALPLSGKLSLATYGELNLDLCIYACYDHAQLTVALFVAQDTKSLMTCPYRPIKQSCTLSSERKGDLSGRGGTPMLLASNPS